MLSRRSFLAHSAGAAIMTQPKLALAHANPLWVPPEDHLHEATIMQWPADRSVYRDQHFMNNVQETIAAIANTISAFEPVIMLADAAAHAHARKHLSTQVELWDIPTNDLWCRDSGPIVAFDATGKRVISHIQFNGWGNKQVHNHDGKVAENMALALDFKRVSTGLIGEAGGMESDGAGTLIAHESSWINTNRNPSLTKEQVSRRLLSAFGADHIIWSPGVAGLDITDYHIDSLVRFVGPNHCVANLPQRLDQHDPFHTAAIATLSELKDHGINVDVIDEPETPRVRHMEFVASYVNYYICNGAIIMAEFGDTDSDQRAADYMRNAYPDRDVIQMNVDALGDLGGGIHCATQQLPAQRN